MNVDISAIAIILSVVGVGLALARMIQSLRADMHREMDLRFAHVDHRFAQDQRSPRWTGVSTRSDQRFDQVDQRFAQVDQRFTEVDQRISELRGELREVRQDVSHLREEMGTLRERTMQASPA